MGTVWTILRKSEWELFGKRIYSASSSCTVVKIVTLNQSFFLSQPANDAREATGVRCAGHVKKTTPLDISLRELCQNPIVLEREHFKIIAYPQLSFLVLN